MRSTPASIRICLAWAVCLLLGLLVALACAWHPLKAIDLHVYYASAQNFFFRSRPMYGPNNVFGWPMLYRYPPLFLCLFRPLALLPLGAVAGLWAGLKEVLLAPLLWMWYQRCPPARFLPALLLSALLLLPFLFLEFKYGNVQFLLVELVCLALLLCDGHPFIGSALLGLAAAIEVWPVFVLPFVAARGRWRFALQTSVAGGILTVAPAYWLGWRNTFHLLARWYAQEKHINALLGDRWYPSQSLRGVMLRYLTRMNYSGLPDKNYPRVNFVSLPSTEVRHLWLLFAVLLGLFALVCVYRCADDFSAYSIFFCFLLVIEPNVHPIIYSTLLWPALFAGNAMADPRGPRFTRWILAGATAAAILVPAVPGSAVQRLMQSLGIDFLAVLLPLAVALLSVSLCC